MPRNSVDLYRAVPPTLWRSEAFLQLEAAERLLLLYLVTGPHVPMSGCARIPLAYLAHDLGVTEEVAAERLARLEPWVVRDEDEVLLLDMTAWNVKAPAPTSDVKADKRRTALLRTVREIRSRLLRATWLTRYGASFGITAADILLKEGEVPSQGASVAPYQAPYEGALQDQVLGTREKGLGEVEPEDRASAAPGSNDNSNSAPFDGNGNSQELARDGLLERCIAAGLQPRIELPK